MHASNLSLSIALEVINKKYIKIMYSIIYKNISFLIVIQIWNSLPDLAIDANNINSFKNKLDKFWANENVKFNWRSDLTGSGGYS